MITGEGVAAAASAVVADVRSDGWDFEDWLNVHEVDADGLAQVVMATMQGIGMPAEMMEAVAIGFQIGVLAARAEDEEAVA